MPSPVYGRSSLAVGRGDHAPDRQVELRRERVVALVVRGHGHDRAGAVLHQHVVGDVHRQPLAVDRVDDVAARGRRPSSPCPPRRAPRWTRSARG